jgi:LuxR family maltose regulon positive regulatory protein
MASVRPAASAAPGRGGLPGERSSADTGDAEDLLEAKLVPPRLPPGYVVRPRVSQLLDGGVEGPLTVLSAGPGWGKTLSVAAWAAARPARRVAWVSLDDGDNDPRVFWAYLLAALRRSGSVPRDNPIMDVSPALRVDEQMIRRIVYGLSRLPAPVVLVLDDAHEVTSSAVLEGVGRLLRHPVPGLRLVLVTRVDPLLPLHRLRVSGGLTELRAADLAFSVEEAAALLIADGVQVSRSGVERLVQRTEGWVAGLQLAALFLHRTSSGDTSSDDDLEGFAGDERTVADYLVGEVLASRPPQLRTVLLHTSVCELLTADLVDALTEGHRGSQDLEQLERANAFVVAMGHTGHWYRCHPMLREMLQHQLVVEEPDVVPVLHRRASAWFASRGRPLEAMGHAVAAADWPLVGRLLVCNAIPRLVSAEREAVGRVLAELPAVVPGPGAEARLCAAAKLFATGQLAEMDPHLDAAEQALAVTAPDVQSAAEVALRLLRVAQARLRGDAQAILTQSSGAVSLLRGDVAAVPASDEYRAIALCAQGTGLLWSGAADDAEVAFREGLLAAREAPVEVARMNMLGHLGLLAVGRGDLREAQTLGAEADQLAQSRGWTTLDQFTTACLTLALVHFHRHELDDAGQWVQRGFAAQATRADRLPIASLWVALVRLLAAQGEVVRARETAAGLRADLAAWTPPEFLVRWLGVAESEVELAAGDGQAAVDRLGVPPGEPPGPFEERVCLARAQLLLGEPVQAEQSVAPARRSAGTVVDEVQAWLVTALAADRARADHRALDAVAHAVDLAEKECVRRPFATFDADRVPRLLDRLLQVGRPTTGFVRELLARADSDVAAASPRQSPQLREALTDRELTVLEYLPTMLSNAEIAAEIYVSVNTVKAHLKALYRKLDVSTRRQAVARARALTLLGADGELGSSRPPP